MKLVSQPKFSDISNMAQKPIESKNNYLFRRKSEVEFSAKKRPLTSQPQDKSLVCFIPMSKIERSSSQLLHQATTCNVSRRDSRKTDNACEHDTSLPRFARNTQKHFEQTRPQSNWREETVEQKECPTISCQKEKVEMRLKIDRLMAINQHLSRETDRMNGLLTSFNGKITELSEGLHVKTLQVEQLSNHIQNREMGYLQLQDMLAGKDRLIIRLQDSIKAIEKQRGPSSCSQVENAESAEIIHELSQKLKYKQIESYLLKKERHSHQQLQKEHKAAMKENTQLRQRLSYYMRLKEKEERTDLRDSLSSLSLSMTSAYSDRFSFELLDRKPSPQLNGIDEWQDKEVSKISGSGF